MNTCNFHRIPNIFRPPPFSPAIKTNSWSGLVAKYNVPSQKFLWHQICTNSQGMSDEWVFWLNGTEISPTGCWMGNAGILFSPSYVIRWISWISSWRMNGAEWMERGYYSVPFSRLSLNGWNFNPIQTISVTTPIHPTCPEFHIRACKTFLLWNKKCIYKFSGTKYYGNWSSYQNPKDGKMFCFVLIFPYLNLAEISYILRGNVLLCRWFW